MFYCLIQLKKKKKKIVENFHSSTSTDLVIPQTNLVTLASSDEANTKCILY